MGERCSRVTAAVLHVRKGHLVADKWGSSRPSNCDGIDAYVDQIVRAAPPFSARQRARIAAILNGDDAGMDAGSKLENRTPDRVSTHDAKGERHE